MIVVPTCLHMFWAFTAWLPFCICQYQTQWVPSDLSRLPHPQPPGSVHLFLSLYYPACAVLVSVRHTDIMQKVRHTYIHADGQTYVIHMQMHRHAVITQTPWHCCVWSYYFIWYMYSTWKDSMHLASHLLKFLYNTAMLYNRRSCSEASVHICSAIGRGIMGKTVAAQKSKQILTCMSLFSQANSATSLGTILVSTTCCILSLVDSVR